MLLMIAMALMTGAAVLAVLWPLSRRGAPALRDEKADVLFYREQIGEVERDTARGLLSPAEAVSARAEVGRRLLRADAEAPVLSSTTGEPALRRRRAASALALSAVPLIGLAVYGALGSPHLSSRVLATVTGGSESELTTALARIESHLQAHPEDLRGWDVVAPVYLGFGRYEDAARAYRAARRLGGETAERMSGLGEALVAGAGGVVSAEAASVLDRALKLDPASVKARFYLALAAEQDGDLARARDEYLKITASSPAQAGYVALVAERLARLGDAPGEASLAGQPVPPEVAAMVEGLDTRLLASGGSEAEWARLVRSYVVLGRRDDALDRLGRAKTALATDDAAEARLDSLAKSLGLAGAAR